MSYKEDHKTNFLEQLKNMDKDEINRLIQEKGKEPKLINPVWFRNKKEVNNS